MRLKNYVISQDILGIQTNSKYIGWSFGQPGKPVSDEQLDKCRLIVRFIVDPLKAESLQLDNLEKYHYWRGELGRDELFYQRNFLGASKLRLFLKGVRSDRPEILANKNYLRFIRFRFNNLHSPGYLLTDLVCALLLNKGLCPLHCSGFSIDDHTVAVVAPPNTGKTLTTMRAVFDAGASFLSEDLGITDGENFYSCPWTSTFRYYDELSMSWILRMRMKLIRILPPAELIPVPGDSRKIDSYIKKDRIASHKRITHLAILARRPGGVEVLDKERALKMILNLNHYEFKYANNPMLTAYSYFNPEFDIHDAVKHEQQILAKLINQSTCFLVQSEEPTKFADLILDKIS